MYIMYKLIYSSLLRREAAIDWPTACDITGVPIPLTARIHQHQLPVKRNLYDALLWSESQHTTCCGSVWHYWLTLVIMHPCALAATEHSGSSWSRIEKYVPFNVKTRAFKMQPETARSQAHPMQFRSIQAQRDMRGFGMHRQLHEHLPHLAQCTVRFCCNDCTGFQSICPYIELSFFQVTTSGLIVSLQIRYVCKCRQTVILCPCKDTHVCVALPQTYISAWLQISVFSFVPSGSPLVSPLCIPGSVTSPNGLNLNLYPQLSFLY